MTDYCDTCKNLKEELSQVQAITNRLQQSGNASKGELRAQEERRYQLEEEKKEHKDDATKAREYYKESVDKCKANWSNIMKLTQKHPLTTGEEEELESLKHCFTLTISADYQQSKLIPSWGRTEQPGSTYYLQKVSHDIFGIIDHREEQGMVYLFDERIGPKNTDHTVSFLSLYWETISNDHPWIKRLAIFLDNATSTNKNKYLFAWAMEMVSKGTISHVHISFMLAGHTKFAPDCLFATIGNAYKSADVFTINELQALCAQSAQTIIETGAKVLVWRDTLGAKYSDLPGVRKLHDFLIVKAHDGQVVMKVRQRCFTGNWRASLLRIVNPSAPGTPTVTYKDAHTHNIKEDKMANMLTMYNRFISPCRRPDYLPPFQQPPAIPSNNHPSTSSASTSASVPALQRKRKQSRCTVEGCDGTGHRNKARWSEGHSTKAGCPRIHSAT